MGIFWEQIYLTGNCDGGICTGIEEMFEQL